MQLASQVPYGSGCFANQRRCLLRPQGAVPSRSKVMHASEPASIFGNEVIEGGIAPRWSKSK